MSHCSESDLILFYYGEADEDGRIRQHLEHCAQCAGALRALQDTLDAIAVPEAPARGDAYPADVWSRVSAALERADAARRAPPAGWFAGLSRLAAETSDNRPSWRRLALAAGLAAAVITAVVAGRSWPRRPVERSAAVAAEAGDPLARARRAAIGDHLERSEGVLLDVINSNGDRVDLSTAQAWAADLIESNRLYRHTAAHAGDSLVASVLDDLERSLLEIVHGPSVATAAQLEAMRSRLDAAALLFKVRMLADELHEQELAPVQPRKRT